MPAPTRLAEASANARQLCTICQTDPLMSVYQPIAISALQICGAAGSSTDKKLLKLALYAVDKTALLLNRSPVGPIAREFLALLEAYERILDSIKRHIENAQTSTNLFSRHISSSRLKNELKKQLTTMLHGGQPASPTCGENAVEILSVTLRASTVICEAPPLNFLKPIIGIAALICETAKTVKSNRDAAEELAKHAMNVTNCVVDRASKNGVVQGTNEDALNILKGALEDVHSHLIFLNKRRRAMSWLLAAQQKDRVVQLNDGLDRALSLFTTTCILSSNECVLSSNELLDVLASAVKQLDGEMSQNFSCFQAISAELFSQQLLQRLSDSDVPGYKASHIVQTLVPKTFRTDGSIPAAYGDEGRLWPPDGVALAEAYPRLESESGGADGKEALERFVEARTALVAEAERLAEDCDSWSQDLSRRYLDDGRTQGGRVLKLEERHQAPHRRRPRARGLVTASWTARTSSRRSTRRCCAAHPPSHHARVRVSLPPYPPHPLALPWAARSFPPPPTVHSPHPHRLLQNKALPILHAAHSARLSCRLQKAVLTAAQAARATAPPGAWTYWPRGYTLQAWAPLRALVDDELAREEAEELAGGGADVEVEAGEAGAQGERHIAAAVAQHVPGLVEAWRTERKRQLVGLLSRAGELEDAADPARGGACGDADADADAGGAGGAHAHAAGADDVLRLDLATSVFTCLGSWVPSTRMHAGRCLIGWAGAGAHLRYRVPAELQRENRLHHEPEGGRGGGSRAARRARSGAGGREGEEEDRAWVCTLCAAHFDKHVLREEARRHVREAHAIPRPVQDSHFMFFPGAERTPRVAALLSEEGLVAEHGCNVVREADWTRVERIAGSSAVEPVSRNSAVEPTPTPLDALPE
ncbi:hypothetical protein C8J57DRAFT_1239551 [Mycena rebaudengoi]|nr:hypothetical protein C8J57DRAFT_1239551 [Mycena rebaudengoi]